MATILMMENPGSYRRRCDATCHNATHQDCACICGGRYHGAAKNVQVMAALIREDTNRMLELAFNVDNPMIFIPPKEGVTSSGEKGV